MSFREFKPYTKYKDSGIEWLGEVPEHWGKSRLRWLSQIYSGGTPDKMNQDYWTAGTIPWLNSGAVNQGIITEPSDFITQEAFENSSTKWIKPDSLVIALAGQGKTKGMVAQLAIEATCNQSLAAITPENEISPRFLFWWLSSNYQNIRNLSGGDLRDGLNLDLIGDIQCPLPEIQEQRFIANFLDQETSRIDTLISEKERLISLLQEYRQALISHAVTKGLDPKVKMKDSGVEWLGEVPEHWEMKRLRFVAKFNPSKTEATLLDRSTEVSFLPMEAIGNDGSLDLERTRPIGELDTKYTYFREGDVTIAKITPCFENGKGAIMRGLFNGIGFGTTELIVARPKSEKTTSQYLYQIFISSPFRKFGEAAMYGAGGQKRVSDDFIQDFSTAFPPLSEQLSISSFLDRETSRIDTLISEAKKFIDLLKEYRSSLITAAVTGKIDVREVVPPGSEKREIAYE